ncbi:MAG: recombination mediator RecR [Thermodesulfobacteriota bacterium]
MNPYPPSIRNAIKNLSRLPGIGQKTAERLAMHLLNVSDRAVNDLARSLVELKKNTTLCPVCFTLSDTPVCAICGDVGRNKALLCVVEGPTEAMAIEKTGAFKGVYHVLHGVLSPMDGIGPDDLRIRELMERVRGGAVREVVIATGTRVEGETTAAYLADLLKSFSVTVTRLASGMPVGGEVKYIDPVTLKNAMEKRYAL